MEMEIGMKESGLIMLDKVLGSSTIRMVITTQVNGIKIKKKAKDNISIHQTNDMKENG